MTARAHMHAPVSLLRVLVRAAELFQRVSGELGVDESA